MRDLLKPLILLLDELLFTSDLQVVWVTKSSLKVMQLVIRPFRPTDKDVVRTLFSIGIQEHIGPCFKNAMTSPSHLAGTLVVGVVGYLLGSVLGAVTFLGLWIGLIYYCCHELYAIHVREQLRTDMNDIPGNFQSRPDDNFWVAEAEVDGKPQILGMVAVVGKQSGNESFGIMFRMIISQSYRRIGLGTRLTRTVLDFSKERGFSKVELQTSSTQHSAVALYKKLGFKVDSTLTKTHAPFWILLLAKATMFKMEKKL